MYRAQTMTTPHEGHGGLAVTRTLKALGVDHLFTLTGGHIFPLLDGAKSDGIRIVDVRLTNRARRSPQRDGRALVALSVSARSLQVPA